MTKKTKTVLIAAIVLVAGVAIAVPIAVHYRKPNFANMTPQQIRRFFDSNEFRDANENKKREIGEQMFEAMQARNEKQVNAYFALSDEDKRTAFLDNVIDEMQARRAEFLARRDPNRPPDANGPRDPNFGPRDPNGFMRFAQRGQNAGQRPRANPEMMRERSNRMTAEMRVKTMEFRRAMRQRMQDRGIQMGGPGGPGGRGGFGGPGGPGGFGGPPN